jgi:acyl-CoA thioesterase FadM/ketosteroid isomerase-like protein
VTTQVRVPPRHCDAQGMMHASRPHEYFEDAFLAWLDGACGGYAALRAAGYDFVIADSRCSYLEPARLDDVLTIEVRPVSAGTTSFTVAFDMERDGAAIIVGTVTYIAARDGRPAELPPAVRAALGGVPPGGRGIDRIMAADLLGRLHRAQGAFYAGGDDAPLRAVLDPAVSWHVPGRNAIAGDYHGVDAVLGYMTARRGLAGGTFRLHPGEILVGSQDHVASLTDGSAVIGGTERRWSTVGLYRIRAGRIAECRLLPTDAQAFDEIWRGR